jgi:hypothetical protein
MEEDNNLMFCLLGWEDRREYRKRFETRRQWEPGSTLGTEALRR